MISDVWYQKFKISNTFYSVKWACEVWKSGPRNGPSICLPSFFCCLGA